MKTKLRALATVITLLAAVAPAATDTWVGGTGNNFSTTANWTYSSGSGPVATGDSVVFGGAGSTTPNNDNTGFTYGVIGFAGTTAYTVGGNAFTLASGGSITNGGAVFQTINNNISLTGSGATITPSVASANCGIALGGNIGGAANLTKGGGSGSVLVLSGLNNFSGVLTFNSGTVFFTTPPSVSGGNLGNPSGITFGGSSTTTLQLTNTSSSVTIASPTITTANASSTALFKNGAAAGTTLEIAAKITGAGNCKQNTPTTTGAVVRFSNDTSDYTGTFSIAAGTTEFSSVAAGGTASSLGAAASAYIIANSSSAATFRYIGSGTTGTGRAIDWQATTGGLTIDNTNSTGSVSFTNTSTVLRSASGNAALTLSSSTTTNTFGQTINDGAASGTTSVVKAGAGGWTLTASNYYSGGTTLNAGTLNIANANALGTGAFTVGGNGTFDNTTGTALTIANAFTCSGGSPIFVGSTNLTINGVATISGANRTITVNANTLTLANAVGDAAGARSLTKAGNGILTLGGSSASTYTGGTIVSAGTLKISGSGTLGASSSPVTVSGGALDLGGTTQTQGGVTNSGAAIVQNGTISGSIFNGTLSSGTAVINATLAGSGTPLTLTGAGNLALLGANTYSGGTTIGSAGFLVVSNDSGLGSSSAGLTFSASGVLAATNNASAINNTVTISSARTITVNGGVTANFQAPDTNNLVIAAKITGSGAVQRRSSSFALGNVRFSNDANDYSGDFTAGFGNTEFTSVADQGTASSLGVGAVGTGGAITLGNANSSGTLRYVGSGNSVTHRPLNWTATTASGYTLDSSGAGTIQFLNQAVMRSGSGGATALILRGSNTGANTLAGSVNDLSGVTGFTKSDSGTWIVAGTNTFTGNVTLNGGVLQVSAAENPGISGPLGKGGTISFLGGFLQSSAANAVDYSSRFATNAGQTWRIDCNGQNVTFATALTNSGGSLIASNSTSGGRLTLSAANTYSGSTAVSVGTLLVSGSVAGSGTIVASGGTLGGTGTVNNTVTVNAGGTLAPGASIGTLTLSASPTLNGTTLMEINSGSLPNADKLVVSGASLAYHGALTVTNLGGTLTGGESFDLFDATSLTGSFSPVNLPALGAGLNWYLGNLNADGSILVNRAPTAQNTNYFRGSDTSLKITISDLMAMAGDADSGDAVFFAGVDSGTQGATVTTNATYIFYTPANNNNDTLTYTVRDSRGGTSSATISVTVVNQGGLAQSITYSPGGVTVVFAAIPGVTYDVERSATADFTSYTTLYTTNTPSGGIFTIVDPSPLNPSGFYRTRHN